MAGRTRMSAFVSKEKWWRDLFWFYSRLPIILYHHYQSIYSTSSFKISSSVTLAVKEMSQWDGKKAVKMHVSYCIIVGAKLIELNVDRSSRPDQKRSTRLSSVVVSRSRFSIMLPAIRTCYYNPLAWKIKRRQPRCPRRDMRVLTRDNSKRTKHVQYSESNK